MLPAHQQAFSTGKNMSISIRFRVWTALGSGCEPFSVVTGSIPVLPTLRTREKPQVSLPLSKVKLWWPRVVRRMLRARQRGLSTHGKMCRSRNSKEVALTLAIRVGEGSNL